MTRDFGSYFLKDNRRTLIVLSAAAGLLSKAINFVMLFAVVPLTFPHFGPERFGVLMTILGYGALFSFVDLGIGSALIRETARANALGKPKLLADTLCAGLLMLLLLGLICSAALIAASQWAQIDRIFYRLPAQYADETRSTLLVFAILFGIALPLQGLQKMYQGLQRAYLTYAAAAVLSIVSLLVLYLSDPASLTMPKVVAWVYGLPALAPLAFLPTFLKTQLGGYRPHLTTLTVRMRALLNSGALYLLLQFGYVLGWSIDGSLTSATQGAGAAGVLAVVQRLCQLVTIPLALVNAPLWAAYSDAMTRGDKKFLATMLTRSMSLTFGVAILGGIALVVFKDPLIVLWFGKKDFVSSNLMLLAASMAVLEATGTSLAMYLNGLHILRPQLFIVGGFILVALPTKYFLLDRFGLQGLYCATIFCYVLCAVIPYATIFRHRIFVEPHQK